MTFFPGSRVPTDSWLGRWLSRRPSANEFDCGVRVVGGELDGEDEDWSYRSSAIEQVPGDDELVLTHGRIRLQLVDLTDVPDTTARPGLRVWSATEIGSGAQVLLAARADAFGP